MKRALAVLLAFVGFSAFGIGTFSGKWETTINILSPSLESTKLTVGYLDFGWKFTSVSTFTASGFTDQAFTFEGDLLPALLKLTGGMYFLPSGTQTISWECDTQTGSVTANGPAYKSAYVKAEFTFAGITVTTKIDHWAYPFYVTQCVCGFPPQTVSSYMLYTLSTTVDPISLTIQLEDCCTGIAFKKLTFDTKFPLCCGITLSAELSFTKAGFDYLSFSGIKIPLCCGVDFTASVKFTTNSKEVTTGLEFGGFADTCFTVYADAQEESVNGGGVKWAGIDIYGWKIKCSLGDCSYVEFLTALNVTKVEDIVGDIFEGNEFEYMKLGFCGAGCCGGNWTVALAVYFQPTDSLFGITRIGADMSIPIMSNLTFTVNFTSEPTLKVGWTFTF